MRSVHSQYTSLFSLLASLDMDGAKELFEREGIDLETACAMTEEEITKIGITRFGDRKRLMKALNTSIAPKEVCYAFTLTTTMRM